MIDDGHSRRIAFIGQIGDDRHGGQRVARIANDRWRRALRFDALEHALQRVADIAGVGVAIGWVFSQQTQDQRLEVAAQIGPYFFGAARRSVKVFDRGFADVFDFKRQQAREDLVHQNPKRVQISAAVRRHALALFRGHVGGRADNQLFLRDGAITGNF